MLDRDRAQEVIEDSLLERGVDLDMAADLSATIVDRLVAIQSPVPRSEARKADGVVRILLSAMPDNLDNWALRRAVLGSRESMAAAGRRFGGLTRQAVHKRVLAWRKRIRHGADWLTSTQG